MRDTGDDGPDRRRHARRAILESGLIYTAGACLDCQIVDVSLTGARVRPVGDIARIDGRCRFKLAGLGVFDAAVRWRSADAVGLEFLDRPQDVAARCDPLFQVSAA